MSRNLCITNCYYCEHSIELLEDPREITERDAGVHYDTYRGMLVADAQCPICLAQYLAWIDDSNCSGHRRCKPGYPGYGKCFDLSFRSSFNDEPGEKDKPQYNVQKVYLRTDRINRKFVGEIE